MRFSNFHSFQIFPNPNPLHSHSLHMRQSLPTLHTQPNPAHAHTPRVPPASCRLALSPNTPPLPNLPHPTPLSHANPSTIPSPPCARAAGILPFGTIFIELYFAMTSIWLGFFYYLFGFALLISLLALLVTAEVSVLCTYTQLCSEDYHWWWPSFHRGGCVALYTAVYALSFMLWTLPTLHGALPILIFSSYMAIVLVAAYVAMGTVGFFASYVFVRYVFGALKSD